MPNISATNPANSVAQSSAEPTSRNGLWTARFGRLVAQHGVATIPQALFHYQGKLALSAQEVWFVCCLLADKWDGDIPRTSLKSLAKVSSLSLCQIRRIRGSLEEKGCLRVVQSFNEQQAQTANCYDLGGLFQALELLIAAEPASANEIQADNTLPYLRSLSGDWSFLERYGRVLIQRGIATIPQALLLYQAQLRLTPQQVWFCCYVLAHKWDSEYPYPSLSKMAERTGYSRRQLQVIQESLVGQGYLRLVPRSNHDGGQDSNGFDFSGLLATLDELLQRDNQPLPTSEQPAPGIPTASGPEPMRQRRGAVERVSRQRILSAVGGAPDSQERSASSSQGGSAADSQGGSASDSQEGDAYTARRGARLIHKGSALDSQTRSALDSQTRSALDSHEEESDQEESDQEEYDSNHAGTQENGEHEQRLARYSPWIAGVISDFSLELNDKARTASNVSRALRIWAGSGLKEDRFVELLQQARTLTRQYQGKQGQGTITNRMGYLFKVLRDLITRAAAPASASQVAQ